MMEVRSEIRRKDQGFGHATDEEVQANMNFGNMVLASGKNLGENSNTLEVDPKSLEDFAIN